MNIDQLVAAAKEIDRLAGLQEQRARNAQEMAAQARKAGPEELRRIQNYMRSQSVVVTDFGGAINDLRRALKAKPQTQKQEKAVNDS